LGGYLLTRYFKRSREESYEQHPSVPPYQLVPGRFGDRSEQTGRMSNPAGRR
jgi:hypothetical protein